ncbi:MAG: peptidoglycan-associated lipoprotein Pal [Pseudomonadota bacterium]
MKRIFLPVLVLGLLGGCQTMGTDDKKEAAVEDRGAAAQPASTTATSGASGQSVQATPMDPRKDPANMLSKRSVYFDFDKYNVKEEFRPMIEAHAAYLNGNRGAKIAIQGNADERGSREYNLALGQRRAEAVRKALSVLGVQDGQMEAVSFGEEKPRRLGKTEEDYAENRRADIVYSDE